MSQDVGAEQVHWKDHLDWDYNRVGLGHLLEDDWLSELISQSIVADQAERNIKDAHGDDAASQDPSEFVGSTAGLHDRHHHSNPFEGKHWIAHHGPVGRVHLVEARGSTSSSLLYHRKAEGTDDYQRDDEQDVAKDVGKGELLNPSHPRQASEYG